LADAGTLILTGANAYTGATTISAGTLQIGNGGTAGALNTGSAITNDGTLAFNRSDTLTQGTHFASVISGSGAVTQAGAGTLILSGANNYTGATTISAGTLQFAKEVSLYNNNTAGAGWTAANIVVGNGGTLAQWR
jgi:fibronectin-binding autotransporter adhesin